MIKHDKKRDKFRVYVKGKYYGICDTRHDAEKLEKVVKNLYELKLNSIHNDILNIIRGKK